MLEAIRSFVTALASGERPAQGFDDKDYRVAVAALLIHAGTIDGGLSDAERDMLAALLKRRFALDDAATELLIEQATHAERNAIDLYHFTRLLNRSLGETERLRVIEMMWEIAFSDGAIDDFEDNLIWRAADLLGVSQHERIALRRRVAAERGFAAS